MTKPKTPEQWHGHLWYVDSPEWHEHNTNVIRKAMAQARRETLRKVDDIALEASFRRDVRSDVYTQGYLDAVRDMKLEPSFRRGDVRSDVYTQGYLDAVRDMKLAIRKLVESEEK